MTLFCLTHPLRAGGGFLFGLELLEIRWKNIHVDEFLNLWIGIVYFGTRAFHCFEVSQESPMLDYRNVMKSKAIFFS